MSRTWNGKSLVEELSDLLGDNSPQFKGRVLGWLNDVIFEISSRHDWGKHLVEGRKILIADEDFQSLEIPQAKAPKVSLAVNGSLSIQAEYRVAVTFVQANGAESVQGMPSEVLTSLVENGSILLREIPTSLESLVVGRNIYLQKDDGPFYLSATLANNYQTDYEIKENTTSVIQAPDYETVRRINGSPYFESGAGNYLEHKDIDQLRRNAQGKWATGNPAYFAAIESNIIATYPLPSEDMEVSFNYYRNPFKLYATVDSIPDLPIYLKPALKAGVVAMGFEYRDRAGQEMKRANYENAITNAISRGGKVANIEYSVRDVYGNYNGSEVD